MDRYKNSKRKLALLRRNLRERERKLKEFQEAQQRLAYIKKIISQSLLVALVVGLIAYCAF